ncbi:hypothetical protein ABEB36_005869 [Hypothenemus hampei]|uniref:CCDC174 alpha/beta GRSR domain-containing protein n=1 Tax=Hypothenemus hampei TaxID=57062 RepID=A0ABD1F0C6_HYPHA
MSIYEISKSSLLSLKAEILRKQEGFSKAKLDNEEKFITIKKKSLELRNKGIENRSQNDLTDEEHNLLRLSKCKLEAKSKLYKKLSNNSRPSSKGSGSENEYLVNFDRKGDDLQSLNDSPVDEDDLPVDEEEDQYYSDRYDDDVDSDNEWVEYTDSLGRTRNCLRKDLEYIKARDEELRSLAIERNQAGITKPEENLREKKISDDEYEERRETPEEELTERSEEMISADMRRETLRKQWEKEEEELRNKSNVHYQNLLFDEARQHGVGYYAFSKDEATRANQQAALKQLREDTLKQQKKASIVKSIRKEQLTKRIKAAENRKRLRLGLPLLEDDPVQSPEPEETDAEEKIEKSKLDEIEESLNAARKLHIRPWDIGKEGISGFYEMSQEEWNAKKRKERLSEFAPPSSYSKTRETNTKYESRKYKKSSNSAGNQNHRVFESEHDYGGKKIKMSEESGDACLFKDHLVEDYASVNITVNANETRITPGQIFCDNFDIVKSVENGLKYLWEEVERKNIKKY